jgi:hypothetical protein
VFIIKPAQRHKQTTKTVQILKNKTPNRKNGKNIAGKSNIKGVLGQKPYTRKKHRRFI